MSVVGGARKPREAATSIRTSVRTDAARDGAATPDARGSNAAFVVDAATGANRATTSLLPEGQRRTTHADNNVSARIDHTQLSRQVPWKQGKPSAETEAVRLAKAGRRTTFISKPPRPVPLGTREAASLQVRSA
jgi:hypothetical protein